MSKATIALSICPSVMHVKILRVYVHDVLKTIFIYINLLHFFIISIFYIRIYVYIYIYIQIYIYNSLIIQMFYSSVVHS